MDLNSVKFVGLVQFRVAQWINRQARDIVSFVVISTKFRALLADQS